MPTTPVNMYNLLKRTETIVKFENIHDLPCGRRRDLVQIAQLI